MQGSYVLMDTVGSQLMTLRERSGLTMGDIAAAASYRGRSSVQKFFNAEYDPPSLDMIVAGRLARALVGRGSPPIEEDEIFALTASKKNDLDRYQFKSVSGLLRDIPVYPATFAIQKRFGAEDGPVARLYMLDLDNPIKYAWHPPCYQGRGGIYALMIFGHPLLPRYKPGDIIFIDSAEPVRFGDDICAHIAEFDADIFDSPGDENQPDFPRSSAMVIFGTFERQDGDDVYIRSFDGQSVAKLSLSRVKEMTRLISISDALVP